MSLSSLLLCCKFEYGYTTEVLLKTKSCGKSHVFVPKITRLESYDFNNIINDITPAKFPTKGAAEIFFDKQQYFRPDSLTGYVTIASQVIKYSVSHFIQNKSLFGIK